MSSPEQRSWWTRSSSPWRPRRRRSPCSPSKPNVRVEPFDELLVDLAAKLDATVVIKGLRAITDFEYEFQMTALNYQLNQELETLFIMSPPQYMYLSSSIVREIASLHGDVAQFVPACVNEALLKKFGDA